jgi:hypothetical protein
MNRPVRVVRGNWYSLRLNLGQGSDRLGELLVKQQPSPQRYLGQHRCAAPQAGPGGGGSMRSTIASTG